MSARVAADLRAAADVLERDGWTQGTYHSNKGCHCALGAFAVVISGRGARPNPDHDEPGRTAAEVIAALRAAADCEEADR